MSKYIQVCPHGYTEKCPTCREGSEDREAVALLAAKDAEIAALRKLLNDLAGCEGEQLVGAYSVVAKSEMDALHSEIAALKAKTESPTEALTASQAVRVIGRVGLSHKISMDEIAAIDAAIREVRGK